MGAFFPDDPEEQFTIGRKSGFARYKELLGENWKTFIGVGFLTALFYIPIAAGLVAAVLTKSLLVALASGLLGGLIFGPGKSCMIDLIMRRMRDDEDHWWYCWKKAIRQNWKASLIPGALEGLFLAALTWVVFLFFSQRLLLGEWGTIAIFAFVVLFLTMIFSILWPQVVIFDQSVLLSLKNAFFFMIFHFFKVLLAALLQIVFWAIIVLFMPWTAFVIPALNVWYIFFLYLSVIYYHLDDDFHIEEKIEAKTEAENAAFRNDSEGEDDGTSGGQ